MKIIYVIIGLFVCGSAYSDTYFYGNMGATLGSATTVGNMAVYSNPFGNVVATAITPTQVGNQPPPPAILDSSIFTTTATSK
jgi:hypothetical protein